MSPSPFSQQTQPVAPAVAFEPCTESSENSWRFVNRFAGKSDSSVHLPPSFGVSRLHEHRPWLDVNYDATDKLSFGGQVSEYFRSFLAMGSRSRFVFRLGGSYRPSTTLTLMAEAKSDVQSSALFAGENMIAKRYQVGLRQQAFIRNYVSLYVGVTRNHYEENQAMPL